MCSAENDCHEKTRPWNITSCQRGFTGKQRKLAIVTEQRSTTIRRTKRENPDRQIQWKSQIARMWRFTRNNGITEGFHRKMKLIQRRAYGFRNFNNYRLRVIAQCG